VRKEVVRVRESTKLRTLTYVCLMVEGVAREVDEALFPRPLGRTLQLMLLDFILAASLTRTSVRTNISVLELISSESILGQ